MKKENSSTGNDALADEIERLEHKVLTTSHSDKENYRRELGALFSKHSGEIISALKRSVDDAKDAARYRWLRDRRHGNNRWPHISQHPRQSFDKEKVSQVFDAEGYHPDRLDAVIDAAMERRRRGDYK